MNLMDQIRWEILWFMTQEFIALISLIWSTYTIEAEFDVNMAVSVLNYLIILKVNDFGLTLNTHYQSTYSFI